MNEKCKIEMMTENDGWKSLQKSIFMRWINQCLEPLCVHISNLDEDLSDGTKLVMLYEILSGQKVKKYWDNPNSYFQSIENVNTAFTGFRNDGIKFVNIEPNDIVKMDLKLTMGVIWSLILHYQISDRHSEHEDDSTNHSGGKSILLQFINSKLIERNRKCANFSSDWRDGKLLATLVDILRPGSIPETEIESQTPEELCQKALSISYQELAIPKILTVEEFLNPNVDEISIMTFLSYYKNTKVSDASATTDQDLVSISQEVDSSSKVSTLIAEPNSEPDTQETLSLNPNEQILDVSSTSHENNPSQCVEISKDKEPPESVGDLEDTKSARSIEVILIDSPCVKNVEAEEVTFCLPNSSSQSESVQKIEPEEISAQEEVLKESEISPDTLTQSIKSSSFEPEGFSQNNISVTSEPVHDKSQSDSSIVKSSIGHPPVDFLDIIHPETLIESVPTFLIIQTITVKENNYSHYGDYSCVLRSRCGKILFVQNFETSFHEKDTYILVERLHRITLTEGEFDISVQTGDASKFIKTLRFKPIKSFITINSDSNHSLDAKRCSFEFFIHIERFLINYFKEFGPTITETPKTITQFFGGRSEPQAEKIVPTYNHLIYFDDRELDEGAYIKGYLLSYSSNPQDVKVYFNGSLLDSIKLSVPVSDCLISQHEIVQHIKIGSNETINFRFKKRDMQKSDIICVGYDFYHDQQNARLADINDCGSKKYLASFKTNSSRLLLIFTIHRINGPIYPLIRGYNTSNDISKYLKESQFQFNGMNQETTKRTDAVYPSNYVKDIAINDDKMSMPFKLAKQGVLILPNGQFGVLYDENVSEDKEVIDLEFFLPFTGKYLFLIKGPSHFGSKKLFEAEKTTQITNYLINLDEYVLANYHIPANITFPIRLMIENFDYRPLDQRALAVEIECPGSKPLKFTHHQMSFGHFWIPIKFKTASQCAFKVLYDKKYTSDLNKITFGGIEKNKVIRDQINSDFYRPRDFYQIALDLRLTGSETLDLRFKGPYEYQVICVDFPEGICICTLYAPTNGDYLMIYQLDDTKDQCEIKLNITDIKHKDPKNLTYYYCVNSTCRVQVPFRIYRHDGKDNYYSPSFDHTTQSVSAKLVSISEETPIEIKSYQKYFYTAEFVPRNQGLHIIQTTIESEHQALKLLPFPVLISQSISAYSLRWNSYFIDLAIPNINFKIVTNDSDVMVKTFMCYSSRLSIFVFSWSEGPKTIKFKQFHNDFDFKLPTLTLQFLFNKPPEPRSSDLQLFDHHLLSGSIQTHCNLKIRDIVSLGNEKLSHHDITTIFLKNTYSDRIQLGKCELFSNIQFTELVFEGLENGQISAYSKRGKYYSKYQQAIEVTNQLQQFLYIKYDAKPFYPLKKVIHVLVDARHHSKPTSSVDISVRIIGQDSYVPQLCVHDPIGACIFAFYPLVPGKYEVVVKLDGQEVRNSPILLPVQESFTSKNGHSIELPGYAQNGSATMKYRLRLPDYNPSRDTICSDDMSIDASLLEFYLIHESSNDQRHLKQTIYDVSSESKHVFVNFINYGVHAICPIMTVNDNQIAFLPKFFFVNQRLIIDCPLFPLLSYRVKDKHVEDLEIRKIEAGNRIYNYDTYFTSDFSGKGLCYIPVEKVEPSSKITIEILKKKHRCNTVLPIEIYSIDWNQESYNHLVFNNPQLFSHLRDSNDQKVKEIISGVEGKSFIYHGPRNPHPLTKIGEKEFSFCLRNYATNIQNPSVPTPKLLNLTTNKIEKVKPLDFKSKNILTFSVSLDGPCDLILADHKEFGFDTDQAPSFTLDKGTIESNDHERFVVGKDVNLVLNTSDEDLHLARLLVSAVSVYCPRGHRIRVSTHFNNLKKQLFISFRPTDLGLYLVEICSLTNHDSSYCEYRLLRIKNSQNNENIILYGPGLYYARIDQENYFYYEAKTKEEPPNVYISGPSQVKVYTSKSRVGSHKYIYIPSEPGKYSIKVGYGEAICTYKEYSVNVYGRMSIDSNDNIDTIDVQWAPEPGSTILQQIIINIPNKSIKLENLVVEVFDKDENPIPTEIDLGSSYSNKKTEKSLIKFSFRVAEFGRFRASVKENGHDLPGSPFFLNITRENTYVGAISCVAYGPSLAEATIGEDNYFYVNMKDAGVGKIDFLIIGPSKVDIMSQECKDNVYIVHWKPLVEGSYSIQIKYDGFHIPGSPFWVKALKKSSLERSKTFKSSISFQETISSSSILSADGPGLKNAIVGVLNQFCLQCPTHTFEANNPNVTITGPVNIDPTASYHKYDDHVICNYSYCPPIEGRYKIDISVPGSEIKNNPFFVNAKKGSIDYSMCFPEGDGIKQAVIGELCKLKVDTKSAGSGYMVVSINSTSGNPADSIFICYLGNGIYMVEYKISFEEEFTLNILFNGIHILGSPFTLKPIKMNQTKI